MAFEPSKLDGRVRAALTIAPMAAFIGELAGTEQGLSRIIAREMSMGRTDMVWGAVLIMIILALCLFAFGAVLERLLCRGVLTQRKITHEKVIDVSGWSCRCSQYGTGGKTDRLVDWFVNPDHGTLYVAEELGYFADAGLEVEMIEPTIQASRPCWWAPACRFGCQLSAAIAFVG